MFIEYLSCIRPCSFHCDGHKEVKNTGEKKERKQRQSVVLEKDECWAQEKGRASAAEVKPCPPQRKKRHRASLVVQWLRTHLPVQGTRVRALVQEDPTCRGATKPRRDNYWACALEPTSHNCWAPMAQLLKLMCLEPVLHNEKPMHCNEE